MNFVAAFQSFRQRHADYGQTVTDHYFLGGFWTAGLSALPETGRLRRLEDCDDPYPFIIDPLPLTLNAERCTLHPEPSTLNPEPYS
jgi:hypothetical protein